MKLKGILALLATLSIGLAACTSESGDEDAANPPPNNPAPTPTPPPPPNDPTTTVNSTDPVIISGADFYQGGPDHDDEYGCVGCHGLNGEGTPNAPTPINSSAGCATCTDLAILTAKIADTMPQTNATACIGATDGMCANDIAKFMLDQWIGDSGAGGGSPGGGGNTAGITVTAANEISTSEDGGSASFSLRLTTRPTSDVIIGIRSNNPNEGVTDEFLVSFSPLDWNQPKTVIVTGVDDQFFDGNVVYSILFNPAISGDRDYSGVTADPVQLTNVDNESVSTAGFFVSPTNGLVTDENGLTATFMVSLRSEPAADVTIGVTSSDPTEGSADKAQLVFTAANFQTAQMVTVVGLNDNDLDGPVRYTIALEPAVSADANYNNADPFDVIVTNNDNDLGVVPAVIVSPSQGLQTVEAGTSPGASSFTVKLNTQPVADVVIPFSSNNPAEGIPSLTSLTFTNANFDTPQTIVVAGVDDAVIDGDVAYSIVSGDPTSADPEYDALTAADVVDITVINRDDDILSLGRSEYERANNNCNGCHGNVGQGAPPYQFVIAPVNNNMCGVIDCFNELELIDYIETDMPPGNPANCDRACATAIAKYMSNNFSITF